MKNITKWQTCNCEIKLSMVFSTSGVRHSGSHSTELYEQQQPITPALHT